MADIVTRIGKGSALTYQEADDNWTNLNDELAGAVADIAGKQPLSAVLTATTASYTAAEQSKLAGIAAGATVNSADATLLARANHTGTQTAATISDFNAAADARVTAGITGKQNLDATLTALAGLDATAGAVEQTGADTFAKRAFGVGAATSILTRGDGDTRFASAAQGALADTASQPGHTHAQADVTGLPAALAAKAPLASPTFTGTVGLPAGQVVNGVTLTTGGGTTNFLRADGTYAAPAGGGGGGGNAVAAALAFGGAFTDKAQTVVTGQAWVAADSKITADVLTPSGTDPDEMYLLNLRPVISDLVAGVGFTVTLYSEAQARGTYTVNCIGV